MMPVLRVFALATLVLGLARPVHSADDPPEFTRDIQPLLKEVIEAAETMELAQIRKAALASIEDLKRKGPGYKRDISTWGQIGQGAIALGCIVAATTGHIELGLPCVIGGAASSAAMSYWNQQ